MKHIPEQSSFSLHERFMQAATENLAQATVASSGFRALGNASELITPGTQTLFAKKGQTDALTDVLKFLKFSKVEIDRTTQLVGVVSKLAGAFNWVIGAIVTVKAMLEFLGFLKADTEESVRLLRQIGHRVEQIYGYLAKHELDTQYRDTLDWRAKVEGMHNAVANLTLSRSQTNLEEIRSNNQFLTDSISKMLHLGEIPFLRATYDYSFNSYPPTHWIHWANPGYMERVSVAGPAAPIPDYSSPGAELVARIWDPGYYLDVLIEAIAVKIASLAAAEPGFRSTGFDRSSLRDVHTGLRDWIDKWNQNIFETTISGPLDPITNLILQPWGYAKTLGVGAVDPVSGIAAFDPAWNEGFSLLFRPDYSDARLGNVGKFYLQNRSDVVDRAAKYRYLLWKQVWDTCGIKKMYELADSVFRLTTTPSGSEFVHVTDATFSANPLRQQPTVEEVSLGIIGTFAGKPDKIYKAQRYFQESTKKVRLSMARRADLSQIQLGYRLSFLAFGDHGADAELTLCDFSSSVFAGEEMPLFPSGRIEREFTSATTTVYDVYQSTLLTPHEEEAYEKTGSIPSHQPGFVDFRQRKQRLYLNPRIGGKAKIKVTVDFDIDLHHQDNHFVGFADIAVTNLQPEEFPDGFILGVTVLETVADQIGTGQQERIADQFSLHFAPSFLVLDLDYFDDRAAGLEALKQMNDEMIDRFKVGRTWISPIDPISAVQTDAIDEVTAVKTLEAYREFDLAHFNQLTRKFSVPVVRLGG